jgi:hypothetical protein
VKIRDRVRQAVWRWIGIHALGDRIGVETMVLRGELRAQRDAEQRRYFDLQHGQQEMEQKIDLVGAQLVVVTQNQTAQLAAINKVVESLEHLINLVEPKAGRLRAGAPLVLDWDEVQRQNAAKELENNDGQPVRR